MDASREITVVVASLNPVKIGAARAGFSAMFPHCIATFRGVSVPSGVPDQPFSDAETLRGAVNRVHAARVAQPDADYWVGFEGGVDEDNSVDGGKNENENESKSKGEGGSATGPIAVFAWIAVLASSGRQGKARTGTFYLPEETAALLRQGVELGVADDQIHGTSNSKQKSGTVGILTDGAMTREAFYGQGMMLALVPFKNTALTFL